MRVAGSLVVSIEYREKTAMKRHFVLIGMVILIAGLNVSPNGLAASTGEPLANTLEVGTSALCAYHTIEDAIVAAHPGDTIKIENTLFTENPLFVNKNLTLAGSYNSAHPYSCLTLTGFAWTTVQRKGTSSAPILKVQNATVKATWITFENNGLGNGVTVEDGTLNLEHIIIRNNNAPTGGGLSVIRSTATLSETEILDNFATGKRENIAEIVDYLQPVARDLGYELRAGQLEQRYDGNEQKQR